ncbi:Piso0_005799 [Millerozyma farinosa CBS 7064]|uniref:Piso0_005799 protein n=1 Tax=Pichia sorbitophila (strain ATCC MYA-4447 / BCRC 22081 / CBS 7064 / NBRC 10061 / NRRL Y-12695) TaxID=559304 RepID=G8Y2Y8_PICSO|nr:Piso0_005799 [Millerozyma farinosa CBS 7064]
MFNVLDRITTVDGHLATIKYVGKLEEVWGDEEIALGVEWDDPTRGKHDGSHNGRRYFTTDKAKAGSFLKASSVKISKERRTFLEALVYRYGVALSHNFEEFRFGKKAVECYGLQKLDKLRSDFEKLTYVSLNRYSVVSFTSTPDTRSILSKLGNISTLDISFNLINRAETVWDIADNLPGLTELNLSGNRLLLWADSEKCDEALIPHAKLRSLKMASTCMKPGHLNLFFKKFPLIEKLDLAYNGYSNQDIMDMQFPGSLQFIDLTSNILSSVPNLFSRTKVNDINLSQNIITTLDKTEYPFYKVKKLLLKSNLLNDWNSIDIIPSMFPNLEEIHLAGNPLFVSMSVDEMMTLLTARLSSGKDSLDNNGFFKINGSDVTPDDIRNAELYFVSKVRSGDIPFDLRSHKWSDLLNRYRILPKTVSKSNNGFFRDRLKVFLVNTERGIVKEREIFKPYSILRVKGIVSELFNLAPLNFAVYYCLKNDSGVEDTDSREFLEDNLALVDSYEFTEGQKLYITSKCS